MTTQAQSLVASLRDAGDIIPLLIEAGAKRYAFFDRNTFFRLPDGSLIAVTNLGRAAPIRTVRAMPTLEY